MFYCFTGFVQQIFQKSFYDKLSVWFAVFVLFKLMVLIVFWYYWIIVVYRIY